MYDIYIHVLYVYIIFVNIYVYIYIYMYVYIYVGFRAGGHLLLRVVELAVAQVRSSRECSTCLTSIRQWGGPGHS